MTKVTELQQERIVEKAVAWARNIKDITEDARMVEVACFAFKEALALSGHMTWPSLLDTPDQSEHVQQVRGAMLTALFAVEQYVYEDGEGSDE